MAETAKTAVLQEETRIFNTPQWIIEYSNSYQWMKKKGFKTEKEMREWCSQNYLDFWDEMAQTYADWFKPYTQILEWNPPYAKWFLGGKCNVAYNAVDRHAKSWRRNKVAYYFVGEPVGDTKTITYYQLYQAVNKMANGLKSLGVKKGDRVSIYLPMIPELPITMLACAKIGAIHSVVFSGFSAGGLQSRVTDAEAKVVVTSDGFYRRGKPLPLKPNVDEAVQNAPSVEKVVVVKRAGLDVPMKEGRDIWYHDLIKDQPAECYTEELDPEDRLFILYTSGTTGKPKGIEHAHGGFCVGPAYTTAWALDVHEEDVYWCTADCGWITGHSYVVYGPLCLGATSILYEGAPDYPDIGRWWSIIEEYGVSVFYTAPTAIRMFMKAGDQWPKKYNLKSIRILASVGEPLNPEAYVWFRNNIGGGQAPIIDTWWQTETGCHVIAPLPMTPEKPGSVAFPLPGFNTDIYDEDGNSVPLGYGGNIVQKTPWPSMLRAFFRDPERYMKEYWQMYWDVKPGTYLAGDKATRDKDGYWWIQGRIDDVLKVAGHRISNAEVESAAVSHPAVAEAAVIGKPDEVKGEVIVAFIILKEGVQESEDLKKDIAKHVRSVLGPVAYPEIVYFVKDVPKTRSGKIMRRVIKAKALGKPVGDISALANPESVENIPLIV
ncbi:MAG: acetate--CoA ligase [Methanothrix sp.]|nr:acetate--CoA ligase [Methanothrix sp.]MCX8207557.1 acetate--CoA ligase [Methanothrix sp.]